MTAEATQQSTPCGTPSGPAWHRRRGEKACDACRAASAGYMRSHRERKGPAADRWWSSTRTEALGLLAAEYPERFAEILAKVRRESGKTPWDPGETP